MIENINIFDWNFFFAAEENDFNHQTKIIFNLQKNI